MSECRCIIVSTPFQLISAFSIAECSVGIEVDLYIIGNFNNYDIIAERVRETGIFRNVVTYTLDTVRKGHSSRHAVIRGVGRQWSYIRYRSLGRRIVVPNQKYEIVYYAAAVSAFELLLFFQDRYKSKFVLFDDGVMTYRNIKWVTGEQEKIQFVKKIIYRKIGKIKSEFQVYSPDLFRALNPEIQNVCRLPVISQKTRTTLLEVFRYDTDEQISEKVVVIESKTSDYMTQKNEEQLEDIYERILDKIGTEEVIFKRHPRDQRGLIEERKYLAGSIPFEMYGCIQDIESKVLLAWDSTAVLTPKLFFEQEPTVILLYNLVNGKLGQASETHRLYCEFAKIYSHREKFYIPNSEEELASIIDMIFGE